MCMNYIFYILFIMIPLLGWGSIQHPGSSHHTLQQAMLPVVSYTNCFNRGDVVCTGFGRSSLTNACRGDSGGPFVCPKSDGSWEQHGVASFVVEYCKYYTAFTPVGDYIDWIKQYIWSYRSWERARTLWLISSKSCTSFQIIIWIAIK